MENPPVNKTGQRFGDTLEKKKAQKKRAGARGRFGNRKRKRGKGLPNQETGADDPKKKNNAGYRRAVKGGKLQIARI